MNIAIIGAGGWGTALSVLLHGKGRRESPPWRIRLWSYEQQSVDEIRAQGQNVRFLPGVTVPPEIELGCDLAWAVEGADLVVLASPSHVMRSVCGKLPRLKVPVVSVAKGIENETHERMTQIIAEQQPDAPIAALSGPSHAEEVARGVPTAVVAASRDSALAALVQRTFMTERFRVYTNDDVIGVELGGALKNVIAIAAGIGDGLGLGDNAKAALVTRGQAEMARMGVALGARRETFFGLSGIGDLIVTCFSKWSRNRGVGERLGRGENLKQILDSMVMVAEGVRTAKAAQRLAQKLGVEAPITNEVCSVIYDGKEPKRALNDLMLREAKPELSS
ncbi:MAG: NAD(P)-dependent glycerol-3-phosphate dehydrogenase [Verrucomicrobia bacterium]|nr:NAD(P)-dependent glycerol-3-phosphate dehydrogenase [Verrucomicrobiota bacterium]